MELRRVIFRIGLGRAQNVENRGGRRNGADVICGQRHDGMARQGDDRGDGGKGCWEM